MQNLFSSSSLMQEFRKGDWILLICFLALAAGIVLSPLFGRYQAHGTDASDRKMVTVRVAGELYGQYPLSEEQELAIQTSYGSNTVVIKDQTVSVAYSDCRNQVCVQHSPISDAGEQIVCLPHRLSIEITSGGSVSGDAPFYDAIVR